jgi:hypothetical protein
MSPATVETFEVLCRRRFKSYLRLIREGGDPIDIGHWFGVCDGMVAVLYDIGSPFAYTYRRAADRIKKVLWHRQAPSIGRKYLIVAGPNAQSDQLLPILVEILTMINTRGSGDWTPAKTRKIAAYRMKRQSIYLFGPEYQEASAKLARAGYSLKIVETE